MRCALLLTAAALAAGGCGFEPSRHVELDAADLAVEASAPQIAAVAQDLLGGSADGAELRPRLILDERSATSIVGREPDGRASAVKLSYVMDYQLIGADGSPLHSSSFRYSQNIAHDDAALRASLLSRERIIDQSRRRAVMQAYREAAAILLPAQAQ